MVMAVAAPLPLRAAHTDEYRAQLLDVYPRYGTGVAIPGGYTYAIVRAQNVGTASWPVDGLVKIRTAIPLDRHSQARSFDWESDTRASRVDLNESDPRKARVDPGEVALFIFTLYVPAGLDQRFCEDFELVADREDGPDRIGNHFVVQPNDCFIA